MEKGKPQPTVHIKNRKASFEFEFVEKLTAGMVLTGTEIKSLRSGSAGINEGFCQFKGSELFAINLYIAEYSLGTYANHEPRRERKLLINRGEARRWLKRVNEKGLTVVPTALFIDDNGRAKLEIALAKGKKVHDKRATVHDRESKVELDRLLKSRSR